MPRIYYDPEPFKDRRSHAERTRQLADANTMEDSYCCEHCGRNRREAGQAFLSVGLVSAHVCDSCWVPEEALTSRRNVG